MRIGTAQPRSRLIDYRLKPAEALAQVDRSLGELEGIVRRAGESGCDVLALPEDTLGLGHWEAGNKGALAQVLPEAVRRMLDRLGRAAAEQSALDVQWLTPHLAQFGAIEIPRKQYLIRLKQALDVECVFQ